MTMVHNAANVCIDIDSQFHIPATLGQQILSSKNLSQV